MAQKKSARLCLVVYHPYPNPKPRYAAHFGTLLKILLSDLSKQSISVEKYRLVVRNLRLNSIILH